MTTPATPGTVRSSSRAGHCRDAWLLARSANHAVRRRRGTNKRGPLKLVHDRSLSAKVRCGSGGQCECITPHLSAGAVVAAKGPPQGLGVTECATSMHISARKEQFNRAYVGALAAQAGINSAVPVVDNDSVDITFIGKDFAGPIRDPQINFQLKCTHQDLRVGETLNFSLSRKNYDDLREVRLSIPRYLAVMEVPESCDDWSHHIDDGTLLRSPCFWMSLKGFPPTDQQSVTVSVPLIQRLTSVSLAELLLLASERRDA